MQGQKSTGISKSLKLGLGANDDRDTTRYLPPAPFLATMSVRAARPTTLTTFTSPPPKPLASEADYNTPTLPFE
jgi:hypothetical protein